MRRQYAFTAAPGVEAEFARLNRDYDVTRQQYNLLLERFERIVILCSALILDSFVVLPGFLGGSALYFGMLVIAVLSHITAVQRFYRARALIERHSSRDE